MAQRIFLPPTGLEGASRVDLRDKPRAFPLASASGSLEEEPPCRGLRIRRLHALRRVAGAPAVQIGLPERNISSSGGIGRLGESEEPRSGPARARDLPSDARQRSIEFPLKLESILGDDYRMGSSMPLSDEARPRFDPRLCRRCNPPIALEPGGEGRQTPLRRLRKTAEGNFLNAIGERSHHEIATQSRRLGAIKPPPFLTHRTEVKGLQLREPIGEVTSWRAVTCLRRIQQILPRLRTRVGRLPRSRGEGLDARAGGRTCARPPFH